MLVRVDIEVEELFAEMEDQDLLDELSRRCIKSQGRKADVQTLDYLAAAGIADDVIDEIERDLAWPMATPATLERWESLC